MHSAVVKRWDKRLRTRGRQAGLGRQWRECSA